MVIKSRHWPTKAVPTVMLRLDSKSLIHWFPLPPYFVRIVCIESPLSLNNSRYVVYLRLLIKRAFKFYKTSCENCIQWRHSGITVSVSSENKNVCFVSVRTRERGRNIPSLCAKATDGGYDKSLYNDNYITSQYELPYRVIVWCVKKTFRYFTFLYIRYLINSY